MCLWRAPYQVNIFLLQKGAVGRCFVFSNHLASLFFTNFLPRYSPNITRKKEKEIFYQSCMGGMGSLLGSWQTYILPIAKFGYICLIEVTTWRPCYITKLRKTNEQTNKQTMNGLRSLGHLTLINSQAFYIWNWHLPYHSYWHEC
jgi:hypothetical protein